jgi:hypothetical protein
MRANRHSPEDITMTFALLLLASSAFAQGQAVPNVAGPEQTALQQLEAAAENPANADSTMDGSKKQKVNRDGTVVESTRRETVVRDVPPTRECDYNDAGVGDGPRAGGARRHCWSTPGYRERVERDVDTVRIVDRDKYNASGRRTGALIGGGIGLLGFLALFAGPIGALVGVLTVAAGLAIGAGIGHAVANSQPDRFERTRERSRKPV